MGNESNPPPLKLAEIVSSFKHLIEEKKDPLLFKTPLPSSMPLLPKEPPPKPLLKPDPLPKNPELPQKEPPPKPLIEKPLFVEEPPILISPPSSLKSLIRKISPATLLLEEIPSDALAKKMAQRWKTKNQIAPISLFSFGEPPEQKKLLSNIAHAIDLYFGPAKLIEADSIEKEGQWDTFLSSPQLKMVLLCDHALWQLKGLMHHYREIPAEKMRKVGNIPLFLLPDLSLYLKDPLLKRSLWKALWDKLSR